MLVLNYIKHITNIFFEGNYLYLFLFIISLITLTVSLKKQSRRVLSLLMFSYLSLLFIYLPLTSVLFDRYLDGNPVFARLWMICPVWIIVACAAVICLSGISNKVIKVVSVFLIIILLIVSGSSIRTLNMISNTDDVYKIRNEAVEISNEVMRLNNDEPTSLFMLVPVYTVPDNFVEGGTVKSGIEQYTGRVNLTAFGCSDEFWNDYFLSDVTPTNRESLEWINAFINERYAASGAEYFAVPDDEIVNSKIDSLGYELLSQAGGYRLYRMELR